MAEVELEHLVRALDEERRVRVRDRPVALECETGRDADHQLLAYAHVEVTRMLADRLVPDLRGDDGDPLVLVERRAGEVVEAFAHRRHLAFTSATMQRGRARLGIRRECRLERLVVAPVDPQRRPALEHEAALDPFRPAVERGVVVDHDRSQRRQPESARVLHRLPVRSLVELGVAEEAQDPAACRGRHRPRRRARGRAIRSRTRHRARGCDPGGSRAASRTSPKPSRSSTGSDALRREHGVVRSRAVAFREDEAVVLPEDAVVENPEDVEGRERAPVVLLVAGQPREERRQVVVAEPGCRGGRHVLQRRTSTMVQVKWQGN